MKRKTITLYILEALVPYTDANLRLSYRPKEFFSELARRQTINESSVQLAFKRAIKHGYIVLDEDSPRLTYAGKRQLAPYVSPTLSDSYILVIFDIPEEERWKRRKFRAVLKEFQFNQIQKSVWASKLDCQEYILETISLLDLGNAVKLLEARPLG